MNVLRVEDVGIEAAAQEAARVLREGGVILYPTETVYGLGVDASNPDALTKLYSLKNRSKYKTALIAVGSVADIKQYGVMNALSRSLAERFLPGPLTLVLAATDHAGEGIRRDDGTIGIRVPDDAFCMALGTKFKGAYTSTSANIGGQQPASSVQEILAQFGEKASDISLIIDDGERNSGASSTIVSCITEVPVILREGAVSREELGIR